MTHTIRRFALLVLVAAAASTHCGGSSPAPAAPSAPVLKVTLLPNILDPVVAFLIGVGDSLQLRASAWSNSFTFADVTPTARWQSSLPGVLGVSPTGTVTGIAPGVADIGATYQSVSASGRFRVFGQEEVADFQVLPESNGPFIPGNSTTAQAIISLRDGTRLDFGQWFASWRSSDVAVATVSSTGAISLVGPGVAILAATYHGRTATASVTVVPVKSGEDALQELGESIATDPSEIHRLTVQATLSYNVVSGPVGTITLIITDRSGTNIGSNPSVSVMVGRGAGATTIRDSFVLPAGVTDFCRAMTMMIPASGVRLDITRFCTGAAGT